MKKIIALALAATAIFALFSGCSKSAENGVVNVYNWGEYIDESIFDDFEEKTGIEVVYRTFETNEKLYSVLKMGGSEYDVIIPSDYMVSRMIEDDMLEKLNFDNIPNFDLLDKNYVNLEYDPTNEYSVPYMWGTVGIIYNKTVVEGTPTSWDLLFDERYKGQILQFDNPRDAFATALFALGYSANTTNPDEIAAANEKLLEQKPIIQKLVMDSIYDLLESGEAAIGPYYAGDYLSMIENNPDLAFYVPEEGSNRFVDAMCIPKGAKNKENAEKFINFMCSTDTALANMAETGYASPNAEAAEAVKADYDMTDPADLALYKIMYPEQELLSRCETFINLPVETLELYNDLWIKIKS